MKNTDPVAEFDRMVEEQAQKTIFMFDLKMLEARHQIDILTSAIKHYEEMKRIAVGASKDGSDIPATTTRQPTTLKELDALVSLLSEYDIETVIVKTPMSPQLFKEVSDLPGMKQGGVTYMYPEKAHKSNDSFTDSLVYRGVHFLWPAER